jgi:hypothetical protein
LKGSTCLDAASEAIIYKTETAQGSREEKGTKKTRTTLPPKKKWLSAVVDLTEATEKSLQRK